MFKKIKKDPAFLLYTSDFLTGTMFMTAEQVGIYVRLLCSQHQHGGLVDKTTFNSLTLNHEIIKSKFIETDNGFYNIRLMEEMGLRNVKSNNLSNAAKDTWEKRKNTIVSKNDTKVIQSYNNSNKKVKKNDTIAIRSEDVNEDIIINNKIPSYLELLEYAKTLPIYKPSFDYAITAKYNAWVANNWKDGYNKPIKNWKTTLQNAFPYFKEVTINTTSKPPRGLC
jgi:uncharacterized protein YdaU (DUF1376 family)